MSKLTNIRTRIVDATVKVVEKARPATPMEKIIDALQEIPNLPAEAKLRLLKDLEASVLREIDLATAEQED